jgi:hypothetical protein
MSSLSDESSSCLNCGYISESALAQCPQCKEKMRGAGAIRSQGWWLIVIGFGLVVVMGVLIINEAGNIYHAGEPGAKVRYTNGPWTIFLMVGFLGLFFSFGVGFLANGLWQVLYSRPNKNLRALVFGLWAVFMFIGFVVQLFN